MQSKLYYAGINTCCNALYRYEGFFPPNCKMITYYFPEVRKCTDATIINSQQQQPGIDTAYAMPLIIYEFVWMTHIQTTAIFTSLSVPFVCLIETSFCVLSHAGIKPFSLEILVIQLASASSSCSSHITIGDAAIEVFSDVCSRPPLPISGQPDVISEHNSGI